ncbi:MAG: FAD-dependent oxidoreductase [Thermoguttaceae bacterium]
MPCADRHQLRRRRRIGQSARDWANKAFEGRPNEIRKCLSCLVGCWQESLMIKRHMRGSINPAIGDERFIHLKPAEKAFRVAVVGGGPGGMEAARIAALRGHQVTLFEKTGELGGAILFCCTAPGKHKMRWYADWLRDQVRKANTASSRPGWNPATAMY